MAKIGTVKVGTETGTEEVPVFEPTDVDNPIVRVQTETGTGALNLVDPSNAELNQLRVQTENNGTLAVSTSISTGTGGVELTAATTLNGQAATLFIYEDTSGNGVADNTSSVQLQDGTNTYSLSDFTGEPGNNYWIELELENSNIEETAVIDYVEIEGVSAVATVDANVPTDTTATVTVYEDTTGNGTADSEQTITLQDGTSSYSLTNLSGGTGNDYWMHIELENSNVEKTAVINNIELSV
ncbi:hypothetical protein ACK3SF_04265 [Candidatus Nanosalina sp. VS9-1]|uniref:hypothetical protein n=1 Tax=Candidatus Nanosalina sp. VS9-1 TaxID=3388566 RepID=UPI0039E00F06